MRDTRKLSRDTYLKDENVKMFIEWLLPKLDVSFNHSYINQKTKKEWKCTSIHDAYNKYDWNGKNFKENDEELNTYSSSLKEGIANNDDAKCKAACLKILEWGGVLRGNKERLEQLSHDWTLVQYLKNAQSALTTGCIESADFYKDVYMSSGFTKIYSLYIDDFIIYDSRVGAALGFLVRRFCEENKFQEVPDVLRFAYGNSRTKEVNRNPSFGIYKFPLLGYGEKSVNHIENNLKANWLLGEVLSLPSKFTQSRESQLRALEAALFMIGYRLPDRKKILYVDMDNVLVDFQSGIDALDEKTKECYCSCYDEVPGIFSKMKPYAGAVEAIDKLKDQYEVYVLSTTPWNNPTAWSDKLEWIKRYFGEVFYKRLILSHHKNLNIGDYLIEDRSKNSSEYFNGELILFGSEQFPDWRKVTEYLLNNCNTYE